MSESLYGIVGEFMEPDQVTAAANNARKEGYTHMDAYSPFPVDGLAEAVGLRWNAVPLVVLLCALTGALIGYSMQAYSAIIDYPLNVGGRPLHSWPAFVPITFELTVLFASVGGVIGMLVMNGLPRPYHSIFNTPHFPERSHSRFYLCIEASDAHFTPAEVQKFFSTQGAVAVWEVPL